MSVVISVSGDQMNDPKTMQVFQEMMDAMAEESIKETQRIMTDLNIDFQCALNVQYFRTRSQWTQEHETELIRLHSIGQPPRICEWP